MRDLRAQHINNFVCIPGQVTSMTVARPHEKKITYECIPCNINGHVVYPTELPDELPQTPLCIQCRREYTPRLADCTYHTYQEICIQEVTCSTAGIPRLTTCILLDSLCNTCVAVYIYIYIFNQKKY